MRVSRFKWCAVALTCASVFWGGALWRSQQPRLFAIEPPLARVVIPAPVILSLYGGDRFLAANLEVMRLAATGSSEEGQVDVEYLIRAQRVVAQLNACHEDNYYLANGFLTWSGAVDQGNDILRAATACRYWDGVPAFFYAVNLSFFERNIEAAVRMLELSAQRWPSNAAALRKFAVMLKVESFTDERLALDYLQQQLGATKDHKLQDMLGKRVVRLKGLLALRDAQRRYEVSFGTLTDLQQLVDTGLLASLPLDPLLLGYELHDGRIELKKLRVIGMENQP